MTEPRERAIDLLSDALSFPPAAKSPEGVPRGVAVAIVDALLEACDEDSPALNTAADVLDGISRIIAEQHRRSEDRDQWIGALLASNQELRWRLDALESNPEPWSAGHAKATEGAIGELTGEIESLGERVTKLEALRYGYTETPGNA